MTTNHKTPKETLEARWSDAIEFGTKRQLRVLRFFAPFFIARGIDRRDVDDTNLREIVESLPVDAAKKYFKQPDMTTRYAANAFIKAFADIATRARVSLSGLALMPGIDAQARAAKDEFEIRYTGELEQLFGFYRLPAIHATETTLAKIAAKGRLVISSANREGIVNGLFNAANIVTAAIGARERLVELCGSAARPIITQAVKAETPGRAAQMVRSLSQLAQSYEDIKAAAEFDQLAVQIATDNDFNFINADLVSRLEPFSDENVFEALGAALVSQAKFAEAVDLTTKIILVRVGSALGALVAISAPASFDIIVDCFFGGKSDLARSRQRPTLFSKQHGGLESQLNSETRNLIDVFYFGFRAAFGFPPQALMAGKDGKLRVGAQSSVNKLLDKIGAPFTGRELRDVAIFRMAWAGDRIATIASAARLSEKYVATYFKLMFDDIANRQGALHEKQ